MFNKLYKKILNIIKENYKYFIFLFFCILLVTIKLPYSIESPGGLINIEDRLVGVPYKSNGSINLTYVSVRDGTIPSLILGLLDKNSEIISNNDLKRDNESLDDANIRSVLDFNASLVASYYVAYKSADKTPTIKNNNIYVNYVYEDAITTLKTGDKILKINDSDVESSEDISRILLTLKEGDKVNIDVINNGNKFTREATIQSVNDRMIIGITAINIPDIEVTPNITYKRRENESGPSGGLMFSLAIYNALTEKDITKGRRISGTGTIDIDGNVGSIGGVKYKLLGAVKNKSDVFLVPKDNYDEAMELKKKNNYKIEIVSISTFDDAIYYLNNL